MIYRNQGSKWTEQNGKLTAPGKDVEVTGNLITAGAKWSAVSCPDGDWVDMAYGNGVFVAVGYGFSSANQIITSPDGKNWTVRAVPEAESWYSVAYGNGLFVAVSTTGPNRAMVSKDNGATWTAISVPDNNNWRSVTFGNGLFVAVSDTGSGNRAMTSPDGITWTARTTPEDNNFQRICFGNGLFVAVAISGTNRIMTSPDGVTWTARSVPSKMWGGVCYGDGQFVAVARDNSVITSSDGITWVTQIIPPGSHAWSCVEYGNGLFVALAFVDGPPNTWIMTSPDGVTWTLRTNPEDNSWLGLTYADGVFVAVAYSGTNRCMISGKKLNNVVTQPYDDPGHIHMRRNVAESSQSGTVQLDHRIRTESATGITITNFQFPVPANWDDTKNPKIHKVGITNGTGTPGANYRFEIGAEYVANGDPIDNVEDETVTWTEPASENADTWLEGLEQELTASLIKGKTHINFLVKRLGSDPLDDRDNSFRLFAVDVTFPRKTFDVEV